MSINNNCSNQYLLHTDNEKNTEIKEHATDEPTEEQKENWISWDDVKAKFKELHDEVEKFKDNKKLNEKESDTLLCYMLLSLYIHVPPRRNKDYQFMNVVKKYNDSLDDDINYLSYEDNRFVFNVYKTSKKYGKQIIEINPDLKACIDIYLKFHPKIFSKTIYPKDRSNFKPQSYKPVKKLGGPGMYQIKYNSVERRPHECNFSKDRNKNYIERFVNLHKTIPPPGKYLGFEKAFTKLSRPISSLSRKRF
jgi:hypothetical protein